MAALRREMVLCLILGEFSFLKFSKFVFICFTAILSLSLSYSNALFSPNLCYFLNSTAM